MHIIRHILLPTAMVTSALALPDGFEIHKFAGPPNADYPAGISTAANGDVYVSSDQNGSLGKGKDMGRIIRCRDTNSDGVADQFVHFIPKIDSPRGGHFVAGTLFLVHPPFLSHYRDIDGDGVSDETKLLVTGFGGGIEHPRGADHTTNGVRMGIDGWLYVAVGDFGMTHAKGADGTRYTLHGGGVARVRPDGSELEPYALMTRNICDTAISPQLDVFSRDNTNDGKGWNTRFHHHTALGDHGYPRLYKNFADEAITPLADYGGGSGTGSLWLNEPGFPGEFGDMLFSCDWTTGNIYYHPNKKEGASFKIEQKVFHKLPRATDIDVDGSSRLYFADWRGGGFTYKGKGKPVGMIQQVTATGTTSAKYQDPSNVKQPQLLTLLASPSGVQRLEAQREILKRGPNPDFAEGIFALAKDEQQSLPVRVAAIFTFKQLFGKESTHYLAELNTDPSIREFTLRAMSDRLSQLEGVPTELYTKALSDPNPRVILQAIIGLKRLNAKTSAKDILAASSNWNEQAGSPRLIHTATAALAALGNVKACLEATANPASRALALAALQRIHRHDAVNGLLKIVASTSDPELRIDTLTALSRLHYIDKPWDLKSWWGTRPDDRGPYFTPVEWEASPKILAALEAGFAMIPAEQQSSYLAMLAKNRIPVSKLNFPGLDPILTALSESKPNKQQLALLSDTAKDNKRPLGQRLECYQALSRTKPNLAMPFRLGVLAQWAEQINPPSEFTDAIDDFVNETQRGTEVDQLRMIAAKQSDAVSRIAWKSLLTVLNSPLAKDKSKQKVRSLIDENPREVGFFLAIAELKLSGFDQQIAVGLSFDNDELIAAAQAAKDAVSSASSDQTMVAEFPSQEVRTIVMKARGDVATGKRLFTSQGCIACHATDLKADQKGPYLGSSGSKFTRDYLIDSILDPNKVVSQGFQTVLFTMKNDALSMGFVTAEADGIIELRDAAGQPHKIKRADVIKEQHLPQSLMPPGLAASLSIEDFTSLIDYLSSMKSEATK